jgi:dTDP-4-dehydrorhamnose reductase
VTGAQGMLGHDVARAARRGEHELVLVDLPELDITDAGAVAKLLARLHGEPESLDAIVNCAAWTNVDGAESQREQAHLVNVEGAGVLADAAGALSVPLLHVSTDYVFDGEPPLDAQGRARPYLESDATGPRSVYGTTKLEGERRVLGASPRHIVVRSAWMFGLDGANFVATMLRLAGERDAVLERRVSGLVHMAGSGTASWNGFAQEIFRQAELDCRVEPASSEQVARAAPRPAWSALQSERDDVLPLPPWQDGLAGYLAARAGMMRA